MGARHILYKYWARSYSCAGPRKKHALYGTWPETSKYTEEEILSLSQDIQNACLCLQILCHMIDQPEEAWLKRQTRGNLEEEWVKISKTDTAIVPWFLMWIELSLNWVFDVAYSRIHKHPSRSFGYTTSGVGRFESSGALSQLPCILSSSECQHPQFMPCHNPT